jgi:hypothetical protein
MPARIRSYDEFPFGFSWVIDEPLERASHALVSNGRVWLVDPVDVPEAIERARSLGEPAAVLQLLDRHNRGCAAVAERLGVLHVKVPDTIPGSPFEAIPTIRLPGWQETSLWWPEQRTLVVAEVLGTAAAWTGGQTPVGIQIFLRAWPPARLLERQPEHLLVGHGSGLHGPQTASSLEEAYARSRSDLPALLKGLAGQVFKR